MEFLKPLFCLFVCAGAQAFVIFQVPTCGGSNLLLPGIKLCSRVEATHFGASGGLQEWCCERADESGLHESGPLRMKQVHQESLNMRPIQILIGHNHDAAIPERLQILIDFGLLQTQNFLNGGQLLVLGKLVGGYVTHIEHFAFERKYTPLLTPYNRQSRDSGRSS